MSSNEQKFLEGVAILFIIYIGATWAVAKFLERKIK